MFPPPLKTCHPERSEGSVVRSEIAIGMPRAGMAQKLAPNFSFKHGRLQSTKFPNRPVGLGTLNGLSCDQRLSSSVRKTTGRRDGKNDIYRLRRTISPDLPPKRSRP